MARLRAKKETPKFGRIGNIKFGKKHEKGYPMALDYFIADGDFQAAYNKQYCNEEFKASTLPIRFLSENDEDNIINERELRNSAQKRLAWGVGGDSGYHFYKNDVIHHISGESIIKHYQNEENFLASFAEKASTARYKAEWLEFLTIKFSIVTIPILGYWQLRTKGKASSIGNILDAYDAAPEGQLRNTIFALSVKMHKSDGALSKAKQYPVISMFRQYNKEEQEENAMLLDAGITHNAKLLQ